MREDLLLDTPVTRYVKLFASILFQLPGLEGGGSEGMGGQGMQLALNLPLAPVTQTKADGLVSCK